MRTTPYWRKRAALAAIGLAGWLERRARRAVDLARWLAPREFAIAEQLAALSDELEQYAQPLDYETER